MAALAAAFVPVPAIGQIARPQCGLHDQVVQNLADKYDEARVGFAINERGLLIELLVSKAGTWTILHTAPNGGGVTCLADSGDAWQSHPPKAPEAPI
jgi:hypothetical protein